MRPRGVNRVVMAVNDLSKAVDLYSDLLNTTFIDVSDGAEPFGLSAAISFDAGIELCAPLPGRDSFVRRFIDQHGEGLMWVVLVLDDVDQTHDKAKEMGIGVLALIADYDQDYIDRHLEGRYKKYKEYMLKPADTFGAGVIIGQIEPK